MDPESIRLGVGMLLFWAGFYLFTWPARADVNDHAAYFGAAGLLMMLIGAFLAEGFRHRGAIALLISITIGTVIGIAVGWLVNSRYPSHDGLSIGLYTGLAVGVVSWILLDVPRRLKARRTGPNSDR